jgi:glycosyltransferase involved in cell wall biosynthesis
VPDTVPTEAGLLVPTDDADAFAVALETLLTDASQCAALAQASARAGSALPSWLDTARIAGAVIDRLGAAAA